MDQIRILCMWLLNKSTVQYVIFFTQSDTNELFVIFFKSFAASESGFKFRIRIRSQMHRIPNPDYYYRILRAKRDKEQLEA